MCVSTGESSHLLAFIISMTICCCMLVCVTVVCYYRYLLLHLDSPGGLSNPPSPVCLFDCLSICSSGTSCKVNVGATRRTWTRRFSYPLESHSKISSNNPRALAVALGCPCW